MGKEFFDVEISWWYRALQWLQSLIFFALMLGASEGFAQESRARAVEPIRVTVTAPGDEANVEMAKAVRGELRKLRDVAIVDGKPDFIIRLNANRVTSEKCRGYAVAVDVVDARAGVGALDSYTGSTPQEVAAFIVEAANRERFAPHRARALNRRR